MVDASLSFKLSMIPFLSRHSKKASLAAQHCALLVLFGASNAPSAARFGGGGAGAAESEESQLMAICSG